MIRIITNTTYGYHNGRFVEPKTKDSEPFSIRPEREAELVAKGIAEYVGETATVSEMETVVEETEAEPVEVPEPETVAEATEEIDGFEVNKEYLEGLTINELKEFASQFGIQYKDRTKKADFIQQILSELDKAAEAEEPADDVPAFDAADAIV